jgi:hypothetical protein
MPFAIAKVLADQRDLLLFRPFKPDLHNHWAAYLAWGLFTTWLAGIGRYWDHPNAALWQYLGLGSVAYVFILALILWMIVAPLRPSYWNYLGVLIFVTLTSLPAILYAIPVEKFMSLPTAQSINVLFLAVIAAWRVGLLIVFLRRAAELPAPTAAVAGLLPIALIVTVLVALNLEQAVFDIMGGNRAPTQNDAAYFVLVLISMGSVLASPILLIAYLVTVVRRHRTASGPS